MSEVYRVIEDSKPGLRPLSPSRPYTRLADAKGLATRRNKEEERFAKHYAGDFTPRHFSVQVLSGEWEPVE